MNISNKIRDSRIASGLTQAKLAALSEVSLPMLQLIEAGKTNPSLQTVQKISDALGLELSIHTMEPNLHELIEYGLPLDVRVKRSKRHVTRPDLIRVLRLACLHFSGKPPADPRVLEALQALLLAFKINYPETFAKHFARAASVNETLPRQITGRHIKLKRIAGARLAEILR